MILENIVVKVISMREKSSIQIATWLTSGYMWGENFVHWDGHYDEVGKSIDELSLGGNDGDDGGDDGHSCDSPVDEVVFCLQQSTRISQFDFSISHIEIWLGLASCLAGKSGVWGKAVFESNTHFFPNQGFWVDFFPNTTFFTVGLRKDGQGQRVPFYYYDNTTPSPIQCFNISEFKQNSSKRMIFITTEILHHIRCPNLATFVVPITNLHSGFTW